MHSVKWVEDNLGITRKTIRYYEDQGLISKASRNPRNDYRDYDENDIKQIWAVKTLIKIGFTAKEVKEIIHNSCNNFYDSLSAKIEALERNYIESARYYEFAKTIKLTGRIPTISEFGSIKFDDFIAYACENFNFYNEEILSDAIYITEKCKQADTSFFTDEDIEKLERISNQYQIYTFHAYFNVLCKLSALKYSDSAVQAVVDLIYCDFCNFCQADNVEPIPKERFADHMISNFYDGGDISKATIRAERRKRQSLQPLWLQALKISFSAR